MNDRTRFEIRLLSFSLQVVACRIVEGEKSQTTFGVTFDQLDTARKPSEYLRFVLEKLDADLDYFLEQKKAGELLRDKHS